MNTLWEKQREGSLQVKEQACLLLAPKCEVPCVFPAAVQAQPVCALFTWALGTTAMELGLKGSHSKHTDPHATCGAFVSDPGVLCLLQYP